MMLLNIRGIMLRITINGCSRESCRKGMRTWREQEIFRWRLNRNSRMMLRWAFKHKLTNLMGMVWRRMMMMKMKMIIMYSSISNIIH